LFTDYELLVLVVAYKIQIGDVINNIVQPGRIFSRGVIGGRRGQWLGGHHGKCRAQAYGRAPSGVMGQSLWVRGQSPLKLKTFWSLDVQRSRQI